MAARKLVYTISNPEALKFMEDAEKGGVNISYNNVILTLQKQVDEQKEKALLKYMYNMYKNSKFYQIYIVNEREFENFIKTMLPIYLDERKMTVMANRKTAKKKRLREQKEQRERSESKSK